MKKLIKWLFILILLALGFRGCQEAAMFTFVQGYYEGCTDSATKDGQDGFRDFKRVSDMEEWCRIRTKRIWDNRHE